MSWLFFKIILLYERLIGRETWSTYWSNYQGYRKALGGKWGLWEIDMGGPLGTFRIWWPSPCEHFPAPCLANSTEPLEVEDHGGEPC
jgi:hypothetical protein